ncbi:hypothetical protein BD311DRAFT_784785 [Dichomitus squalens]|uniref:Uncharacterized protein n=2 Tax=Dichomitus squalens TaxID=114155 RepID=A0A4Q9N079_9APHY|nr:hypothetical protein BD311DRAFT_784785 [Dichomitus squalens]
MAPVCLPLPLPAPSLRPGMGLPARALICLRQSCSLTSPRPPVAAPMRSALPSASSHEPRSVHRESPRVPSAVYGAVSILADDAAGNVRGSRLRASLTVPALLDRASKSRLTVTRVTTL